MAGSVNAAAVLQGGTTERSVPFQPIVDKVLG
jgi:hypothetical protein